MLDCLRLHGTSDTQSLFELCSSRGKKILYDYQMCFALSLRILFTDAAMCLSVNENDSGGTMRSFSINNTYFFHFVLFTETQVKIQGHFQRDTFYNSW